MFENPRPTWRPLEPAVARRDCHECGGTGWRLEVAAGQTVARRCECRLLCRSIRLKEELQIPARYEHCTLDAYRPQTLSQLRALRAARRFVERYPNVAGGLFIAGGPGVGKTHLAVGILLALASRYREGLRFVDFGAMLEAEACRRAAGSTHDGRGVTSAGLLVIDGFGSAPVTDSNLEHVEWVLQSRWNSRRLTILTGGFPTGRSRAVTGERLAQNHRLSEPARQSRDLGQLPAPLPLESVPSFNRGVGDPSETQAFFEALSAPIRARLISDNRVLLVTGSDFRREGSRGSDRNLAERIDVTKVA
jgi:DNA replication protein DnaC